jgi:hypothetical protein
MIEAARRRLRGRAISNARSAARSVAGSSEAGQILVIH